MWGGNSLVATGAGCSVVGSLEGGEEGTAASGADRDVGEVVTQDCTPGPLHRMRSYQPSAGASLR
jgi:hypothetical protein